MQLTTGKTGHEVTVSKVGPRGGLKKVEGQTFTNQEDAFAYQLKMEAKYPYDDHVVDYKDLAYFR